LRPFLLVIIFGEITSPPEKLKGQGIREWETRQYEISRKGLLIYALVLRDTRDSRNPAVIRYDEKHSRRVHITTSATSAVNIKRVLCLYSSRHWVVPMMKAASV